MADFPRSYLFVPGNRPDRFAKAFASDADAVIVDLEDAVPAAERPDARANVAAWLSPHYPVWIRVNGADSEWFRDDIALATSDGVAGIILPKAERVEDIAAIDNRVLPLIETARGFWNLESLAYAPKTQRLLFGSIDFQLDLSINGDDEELLYFRSQLVLVSRIAGLPPPVDGITAAFDSPDPVRSDSQRSRRLGFGGKLCIHPKQIPIVNDAFAPTPEEIARAQRIVSVASLAGGAATALDGEMIDRPVTARAEAILRQRRSNS